tara:strand:+ start:1030 stop:1590 length:561 start_codon:yes stop_codon:yes gene_type:complete
MAKRRKDTKVKNTDGISRVKPIQEVGTDPETGKKIQNIIVKRADGAVITTRYADGEKVGETTSYKKILKKKRIPKLKVKRKRLPRKLKPVKVPDDVANWKPSDFELDEDAKKEVKRREEVKKKKEEQEKRIAERKKGRTKKKVRRVVRKVKDVAKDTARKVKKVFKRRPRARKVKNLVTGGTNILR